MTQAGSVWVEGSQFHFIDGEGIEWVYDGSLVSSNVSGESGSVWIEGDTLCYIDESSDKRELPVDNTGSASGVSGSVWIENDYIAIVNENSNKSELFEEDHTDTSHTNSGTDYSDHTDTSHTNSGSNTDYCSNHLDVDCDSLTAVDEASSYESSFGDGSMACGSWSLDSCTDSYTGSGNYHADVHSSHTDTSHSNYGNDYNDHTNTSHTNDGTDHNNHTDQPIEA